MYIYTCTYVLYIYIYVFHNFCIWKTYYSSKKTCVSPSSQGSIPSEPPLRVCSVACDWSSPLVMTKLISNRI